MGRLSVDVQRQKKGDGPTDVFRGTAYTYKAIITNDRGKKSNGLFVINHYNKRGGIERNFDTLRNDFSWALIPLTIWPKTQLTCYLWPSA